ncbi:MAG: CDP-alcohol phosphatidyltransferase family protein [Bacteroidota bacterium]
MRKLADNILKGLIIVLHEQLGLTPNAISTVGFIIGIIAAIIVCTGHIGIGLAVLALSQIVDGLDGGVARRYNLQSEKGEQLDMFYDRINELAIFLALAYIGTVSFLIAILAFIAILLVTMIEPLSGFDPGFKRFMLYFGYFLIKIFQIQGLQLALNVVFFANLIVFAVGTIIVDYRLQREIDTQAILRRDAERLLGLPQSPDDPPSFLSKLFS